MTALRQPPPLQAIECGALVLDFDGTLVRRAERTDSIRVPSSLAPPLGRLAAAAAPRDGRALQPGSMVVELIGPGAGKGDALRALMAEPPFAGAVPVVVGYDLTYEHAFRAAAALGGFGVLVRAPRDTAATF